MTRRQAGHTRVDTLRDSIDMRRHDAQRRQIGCGQIGGEDRLRGPAGYEHAGAQHVCGVSGADDGELIRVESCGADRRREDAAGDDADSHYAAAVRATKISSPGYVDPYSLR